MWLLNVYNSDGIGTDRTAYHTPDLREDRWVGPACTGGIRQRRCGVEGVANCRLRIASAGALTAYGLRETYVPATWTSPHLLTPV